LQYIDRRIEVAEAHRVEAANLASATNERVDQLRSDLTATETRLREEMRVLVGGKKVDPSLWRASASWLRWRAR